MCVCVCVCVCVCIHVRVLKCAIYTHELICTILSHSPLSISLPPSFPPRSTLLQHPFVTEFNERLVRIQMKDQIDIMKRKKISPTEQYSSGEGEGDSLDPPTIKKPGGEMKASWQKYINFCYSSIIYSALSSCCMS